MLTIKIKRKINKFIYENYTLKNFPLKVKSLPIFAQIEVTNVCNLRCFMCSYSIEEWHRNNKPNMLSYQKFEFILKCMPSLKKIRLNGVGEPFLNKDFIKMIAYANSRGISTEFYTNATLLNEHMSHEVVKVGNMTKVLISIDAITPEVYKTIRVGADYAVVIRNIENFVKIKNKAKKRGSKIIATMVLMRKNINEILKIIDFLSKNGITVLNVDNLSVFDAIEDEKLSIDEVARVFKKGKDYGKTKGVKIISRALSPSCLNLKYDANFCIDAWNMLYINVSGKVNPCCFTFSYAPANLGNIFTDDFQNIWNGEAMVNFRKKARARKKGVYCDSCPRQYKK